MLGRGERGSANSKDTDLGKIHMLLALQHRQVFKYGMPFMAPTVQKMGKQAESLSGKQAESLSSRKI